MDQLGHIRHFVTVAREMHFSRAAEILNISQPSLSQSIRQLEREMGVLLLQRTSRRVHLTAAGQVFYDEAIQVLKSMEQANRAALRAARGERGTLTIGYVTSAIMAGLHQRIRRYHEEYPEVSLVLRELLIDSLIEQVHLGTLDFICTDSKVLDPRLQARDLESPPFVLAIPSTHPLAAKRRLHIRDLANEPFVFPTNHAHHMLHDAMFQACRSAGFSPDRRFFADTVPCAVSLVAAHLGVALVYRIPGYRPPGVVYKHLDGLDFNLTMQIAWRRNELTPAAANFLRIPAVEVGGIS
jgi:DNA-binding transcriptional LysR family regulator